MPTYIFRIRSAGLPQETINFISYHFFKIKTSCILLIMTESLRSLRMFHFTGLYDNIYFQDSVYMTASSDYISYPLKKIFYIFLILIESLRFIRVVFFTGLPVNSYFLDLVYKAAICDFLLILFRINFFKAKFFYKTFYIRFENI